MASIAKRRRKDGSTSWDVTIRRRGFATACKSFPTKLAAELWAGKIEGRIAGNDLVITRGTLGELIEQARPYLKDPDSAALRYWETELGDRPLRRITPQLIALHRDALIGSLGASPLYRKKKPRAGATTRKYLIALSAVYTVGMRDLHICSTNPVRLVKKPPEGTPRTRFLNDDEREALLRECRASTSGDLYPAALLALTTGLRWGELRAIQWQYVDLKRRWIVLNRSKNGDPRGLPLTHELCELLRERRGIGEARVFSVDVTKAWKNAMGRAGIHEFRWHDLRHSCASFLVQNGATLHEVGVLLGHRSAQSTKRYAHLANEHTAALVDRIMGGVK